MFCFGVRLKPFTELKLLCQSINKYFPFPQKDLLAEKMNREICGSFFIISSTASTTSGVRLGDLPLLFFLVLLVFRYFFFLVILPAAETISQYNLNTPEL
jgi:hypothetical protein